MSRWAPFAAKFVEPVALSKRVVSSSGVTKVSAIVNPTRKEELLLYLSRTRICSVVSTKCPRIKNIPASTVTTLPKAAAGPAEPDIFATLDPAPLLYTEVKVVADSALAE